MKTLSQIEANIKAMEESKYTAYGYLARPMNRAENRQYLFYVECKRILEEGYSEEFLIKVRARLNDFLDKKKIGLKRENIRRFVTQDKVDEKIKELKKEYDFRGKNKQLKIINYILN